MKILLIDNGTKHLGRLKELLRGNIVDTYNLFSKYPSFDNYDLVVLSGGSQISIVTAPEIFSQEIELVRNSNTPIIGICQGCEILAYAYGSELKYLNHKTKGTKDIKVEFELTKLVKQIRVYEAHHFAIQKLGKDLVELASSDDGIEAFRHKTKSIYGLQFHPEMVVEESEGQEFFEKVITTIIAV